jgi:hypothetical protein
MSNAYSEQNAAWREKLIAVTRRLSDADLGRAAGGPGWTVAGLLGHLAFYDLRASVLLARWKKDGITASPNDVDIVNDATKPLFNAVDHHEIRRLVVEAATTIDAAIDALDPAFVAKVEAEGKPVRLNRAAHRELHLEQIEKALA